MIAKRVLYTGFSQLFLNTHLWWTNAHLIDAKFRQLLHFFVFDSFAFCSRLLYTCSSWFATFLNKCRFAWIKLVGPFLTDAWMIMQCWWFCLFFTHSTFIVCMWRTHRIKWEWSLSHYRHHCNALLACLC